MTVDSFVGRVLRDTYRIERPLGSGGVGAVYVATHLRTGSPCAVKILRGDVLTTDAARRFKREATLLGSLSHPSIVAVHDFDQTDDGIPFIVMDLYEGEDLDHRIQRGALSWDEAHRIITQLFSALTVAHAAGVMHRDIKPANVLLSHWPGSTEERVVLLDFGLAKLIEESGHSTRLTSTGTLLGTPLYMSPEQARGEPLDVRTDIYSLAAVIFEMLTGQPPFIGSTIGEIISKLLFEPPAHLRAETVPTSVDAALQCALAKDRSQRFPDIGSFQLALTSNQPLPNFPATQIQSHSMLPDPAVFQPATTLAMQTIAGSPVFPAQTTTHKTTSPNRGLLVAVGITLALIAGTLLVALVIHASTAPRLVVRDDGTIREPTRLPFIRYDSAPLIDPTAHEMLAMYIARNYAGCIHLAQSKPPPHSFQFVTQMFACAAVARDSLAVRQACAEITTRYRDRPVAGSCDRVLEAIRAGQFR